MRSPRSPTSPTATRLAVHMDGARFANALVTLGCHPGRRCTWRAGVDVLSFGATKNGALERRGGRVL